MDRHGLTPENLLRTLPDVLQNDEDMLALATAISHELAAQKDEIDNIRIYTRIDELPEELLDILAFDFKVDWWDPDYTLEQKRQTLKDSWDVHRSLGTKGAVVRAISAIYTDTTVAEWFEYGGPPFHFMLNIDATYEHVEPAKHQRVLSRLEYYKNLRSAPFGVAYGTTPQGNTTAYVAVGVAGIEMTIVAEVRDKPRPGGVLYAATKAAGMEITIYAEVS